MLRLHRKPTEENGYTYPDTPLVFLATKDTAPNEVVVIIIIIMYI